MAKDSAKYAKPASQVDVEERRDNENRSNRILTTSDEYKPDPEDKGRSFAVEGNDLDGYLGTNPEYQTYANETEAPLRGENSVEEDIADDFVSGMEQQGIKEESDEKDDSNDDTGSDDSSPQSSSGQPPSSA